jgi:hypothetical protein
MSRVIGGIMISHSPHHCSKVYILQVSVLMNVILLNRRIGQTMIGRVGTMVIFTRVSKSVLMVQHVFVVVILLILFVLVLMLLVFLVVLVVMVFLLMLLLVCVRIMFIIELGCVKIKVTPLRIKRHWPSILFQWIGLVLLVFYWRRASNKDFSGNSFYTYANVFGIFSW